MRRPLIALLGCLSTMSLTACGQAGSESTASSSGEALTALTADEIVGTMVYGDTRASIAYTNPPRYRAFQFRGASGDAVDAWVRSTNGVAMAWLLDDSFANVAYGVNTTPASDAHLTATLPAAGTYYVAFREASLNSATFNVSLANGAACNPETSNCDAGTACNPEKENCTDAGSVGDVFDSASCQGAPLTQAGALQYFAPAAAVSSPLGNGYQTAARIQTCTQLTGCTPWSSTSAWPQVNVGSGASHQPYPSTGPITLQLVGSAPSQTIQMDVGGPISSAQPYCNGFIGSSSATCNYYPGALYGLQIGPTEMNYPPATVTSHCLWLKVAAMIPNSPDSAHFQNVEAVIYANY